MDTDPEVGSRGPNRYTKSKDKSVTGASKEKKSINAAINNSDGEEKPDEN